MPSTDYTHVWLKAAFVLLRIGAIAPETYRAKNRDELLTYSMEQSPS
jgi:hypothetical protein